MGIYEHYYNCGQEPFRLNPDPSFLYLAESHREALAQLQYTVETRRGFAVLTGEVGTGKSTLLRALLDRVGEDVQTAYIFNPPLSLDELYRAMEAEWEITLGDASRRREQLNRYLLARHAARRNLVLIFDEAQGIAPQVLEEIRLLSNLETSQSKLVQIILAGQPEFDAMLDSTEFRALRQRVAMRHRLQPLNAKETMEYIDNRLRIAGATESPFTPAACEKVFQYSEGLPRIINLICDNAMLASYGENKRRIEKSSIESVARNLGLDHKPASITTRSQPASNSNAAPVAIPISGWSLRRVFGLVVLILLQVLVLASINPRELLASLSGVGQRIFSTQHALTESSAVQINRPAAQPHADQVRVVHE
ncbi:MAG TPA: AAA family ATPase [Candidatus Binataceae bacterium]|nr:AAA family ATPase [Candidatus Binataceae bacterium]